MSLTILDSTSIDGTLVVSSIANATVDTDKFLVSDSGILKYRTGAQVRSDIGAGTGNGTVTSIGVAAGTGMSGGGTVTTAGTVTLTNADRGSSQNIFKNVAVSGQTTIVADTNNDTLTFAAGNNITLSTNAATDTLTITANINPGDITGVTASAPLTGGGTSGNVTVGISQSSDATDGYLSAADWGTFNSKTSNTGTVTSVGGTGTVSGLTLSGTVTGSGNLTLGGTLALTSTNVTTALGFTPYNDTNPAGYTTNVGTVTGNGSSGRVAYWNSTSGITSDAGLTFNGSTNALTVSGAVTWSGGDSTESNSAYDNMVVGFGNSGTSTKTLTLTQQDGGTLTTSFSIPQGDITAVVAGTGMSGGGTSGSVTLTNAAPNVTTNLSTTYAADSVTVVSSDGTNAVIDAANDAAAGVMTVDDRVKLDGIADGATNVTNNNQLTNGAGYTTNTGTTTASNTQTFTNKSGNISQWTNDSGYTTNVGDITGVTAGTGISGGGTSGTVTITNSDRGSSQNIFKNVAVSGQTTVVADSNNDTLTFAAGNNITLTTDATTDTVTITANINPGDITGVTAGTGLSGGGTSGTVTLSIDSTVATLAGTQTFTNKSGNISQWTNDSGYTTNVGDITGVTAGTGLSGGGTSGTVTLTNAAPNVTTNLSTTTAATTVTIVSSDGTDATIPAATIGAAGVMTGVDKAKLDGIAAGATNVTNNNQLVNGAGYTTNTGTTTASNTQTFTNKSGNISQWTNDSGYTTNVGDITGVTAGAGISGGGTSGTVTITNSDKGSSQEIFKHLNFDGINFDAENNDDTITFEPGTNVSFATDPATKTVTISATSNPGDITGVTAGTGLSGGGTSGTVTLTNAAPNVTTNLSTTTAATTLTVVSSDGTNAILPGASTTVAGVMTGADKSKLNGIAVGATNVTNNNQLTNGAGYTTNTGTTTASNTQTFTNKSGAISQWTNDAGYTTNVGDITGVIAGTNLTGGGSSGDVTLNMATGGAGAGTYGSTTDGTKLDTITLDAYGRVTGVTTGATGDIQGVTAGAGMSGGGTSGTVTLTNADKGSSQEIFKHLNFGGINFDAENNDDTITFEPGSNVSFATDPATKTVTISATSNPGDITGVVAGTGMSGGGTSGTVTLNCTIDSPSEVGLGNLSANGNSLSGNFTATGNITAYSDERLKANIETIPNALEKVNSLRGVTFDKDGVRGLGVIAQEVEKILPEVVMDGEEFKSVAYGNIVGVLIEAIKELTNEVEELKRKLN